MSAIRQFSTNEAWNDYCNWLIANGAFIHESLAFPPDTSSPTSGARCVTSNSVSAGGTLVSCPHALVLDVTKAAAAFPGVTVCYDVSRVSASALTPHAMLCFFICRQKLLGQCSFWWPYMRILPADFDTPLYAFDHDDMGFLDGCNMDARVVEAKRAAWKDDWESAAEILTAAGENIDGCSWELFRWAATLLTSRGFPEILTRDDAEQVPQLQRYLNEPGFKIEVDPNASRSRIAAIGDRYTNPSLVPLLDSLNHRPRERITWRVGNGQLGFETVDGLPPGVEVYNNYGAKSNEELLAGYGFALLDNPSDSLILAFSPRLSEPQMRIREHQPQPSIENIYHLTLDGGYPEELTTLFHILTASPSDRPLLEANPAATSVSIRNSMATEFQLFMALKHKLGKFMVGPGEPKNQRQHAAKMYRDGQKAILLAAVKRSEEEIARLLAQYDGKEIFTIETAMKDEQFAEATGAAFKSHTVAELFQDEQEDVVLAFFLCWKFLTGDYKWRRYFDHMAKFHPFPQAASDDIQDLFDRLHPDAADRAPKVFGGDLWTPLLLGLAWELYTEEGANVALWGAEGHNLYAMSIEVPE